MLNRNPSSVYRSSVDRSALIKILRGIEREMFEWLIQVVVVFMMASCSKSEVVFA